MDYLNGVAKPILRRMALLLTALAFVLATTLPIAVGAMAMPATTIGGMAVPGMPCERCPGKTSQPDGGKMMCGALACAGVAIGLPGSTAAYLPEFAAFCYPAADGSTGIGALPTPDPFPPRPIFLA